MNRKGNPLGLIEGIPKNRRMPRRAKEKAIKTLEADARRRGLLPKLPRKTRQPELSIGEQISEPVISPIGWYFILSIGSIMMSWNLLTSLAFSVFQLVLLVTDVEEAEKGHKLLQNTLGALVTFGIGWGLNDIWAWGGAILVLGVISLVVIGNIKAYFERVF